MIMRIGGQMFETGRGVIAFLVIGDEAHRSEVEDVLEP